MIAFAKIRQSVAVDLNLASDFSTIINSDEPMLLHLMQGLKCCVEANFMRKLYKLFMDGDEEPSAWTTPLSYMSLFKSNMCFNMKVKDMQEWAGTHALGEVLKLSFRGLLQELELAAANNYETDLSQVAMPLSSLDITR